VNEELIMVEYSIVIPVYNSEHTLEILCRRLQQTLSKITENYEVILVDDGSQDASWSVLARLHNSDKRIKVIRFTKNFGQHHATICGFKYCGGKFVITMDDDLQHPPEEIPKLISEIELNPGLDLINGMPEKTKHPFFKSAGRVVMRGLSKIIFSNQENVNMSAFRIINSRLAKEISKSRTRAPAVGYMLLALTDKVKNIKVKFNKRVSGKSGYGIGQVIKLTLDNILNFSALPLRLVSVLGVGTAILSALLSIFYIIQFFSGRIGEAGWITLVLLILFFSGVILFSFGIVGEYLFRLIKEVNSFPRYFVIEKKID